MEYIPIFLGLIFSVLWNSLGHERRKQYFLEKFKQESSKEAWSMVWHPWIINSIINIRPNSEFLGYQIKLLSPIDGDEKNLFIPKSHPDIAILNYKIRVGHKKINFTIQEEPLFFLPGDITADYLRINLELDPFEGESSLF